MADSSVNETTSSGRDAGQSTDATIEIKIKMLDSQIYTLRVDKTMPIPVLKEKIAAQTGVPLEQQRLICRGKVLKDDHQLSDYHVEDGHTLHLVVRQPLPPTSSTSTTGPSGGEGTSEQQGADPTAGAGRNRIGHVSHNVVVGTFNLQDQGDGGLDLNRLISNVLTSIGIGNLGSGNGPTVMAQGTVPEGQNQPYGASGVSQTVNQQHTVQVIPDALTTLSQYLNRMVQAFSQDGFEGQSHSALSNSESQDQVTASGSVPRGLPRPAVLGSLIQRTQQLLNGPVRESFSQLAGMLEGESTVTDPTRRSQIQSAAMRNGTMMQQLGALLLELARSTLTLQMGQSHDESIVNAGPAIFISSSGPNPIMVQPLPSQHGVNFGAFHLGAGHPHTGFPGGNPATGEVPRNINIHIHAGSTLVPGGSPVNPGGSVTPNANADQENPTTAPQSSGATDQVGNDTGASRETGPVRVVPVRTVVAAVPVRPSPEPNNATFSVAYPLLARIQQLNFPQGVPVRGQVQATVGVQSSGVDTAHQQSMENVPLQSILSQIHAQMQSSNGGLQTLNFETQNADGGIQIGNSSLPSASSAINIPFSLQHSSQNHTGATTEQNLIQRESSNEDAAANADGRDRVRSANNNNVTVPVGAEAANLFNAVMQQIMGSHERSGTANQRQSDQQQTPSATSTGTVSSSMTEQNMSNENIDDDMKEDKKSEKLSVDMAPSLSSAVSDGDLASTSGNAVASTSFSSSQSEKLQPKRKDESPNGGSTGPVGLGLGGLQPLPSKRAKQNHKVKASKLAGPDSEGEAATGHAGDQDKQSSIERGQNVLQALVSQGISSNHRTDENGPAAQMPSGFAHMLGNMVSGGHTGTGRLDVGDVMSQLLQNPTVNNILSMSEQTGTVPQGALRNMMEQITRSPALRNTVQQMTEQLGEHSEEIENVLSGMGGEQGGFDFSRMMQQMLPLVSQVLTRGSNTISSGMDCATQTRNSNSEASAEINNGGVGKLQIDLEPTVQKLENHDPPNEVFRSMVGNASALYSANEDALNGLSSSSIFDQLSDTEDLANEYLAMLSRDLLTRLESDTASGDHL